MIENIIQIITLVLLALFAGALFFAARQGRKLMERKNPVDFEQIIRRVHETISKDDLARTSHVDGLSKQLSEMQVLLQEEQCEAQVTNEKLTELKNLSTKISEQATKLNGRSKKYPYQMPETYLDELRALPKQLDEMNQSWLRASLTVNGQVNDILKSIEKGQLDNQVRDQWFTMITNLHEDLDLIKVYVTANDSEKSIQPIGDQENSVLRELERQIVALQEILQAKGYKECLSCGNLTVTTDAHFCYRCGYNFEAQTDSTVISTTDN